MKTTIYLVLLTFILFSQCKHSNENIWPEKTQHYETIKIDSKKSKRTKTSEIFDEVTFIKLESNENILMGEIVKLIVSDKFYHILCSNGIFIFNSDGTYQNKITRASSNEIIQAFSDIEIDTIKNTILVYDNRAKQFVDINYDGKVLSSWKNYLDGYSSQKIDENIYAIYIGASYYNKGANHKLNFVNKQGEIISKCFPINENETNFMHFGDLNNFSVNSGIPKFLYSFNDTVYSINQTKIIPELYFDFGQEKLPSKVLSENYKDVMHFYESLKTTDYSFRINGYIESEGNIIFSYANGARIIHGIFSKRSKNLQLINEYIDDLSFGGWIIKPDFLNLPRASFKDKYYSFVDSYDFIQRMDTLQQTLPNNEWVAFINANPKLIDIYKKSSVIDNPILCKIKIKEF